MWGFLQFVTIFLLMLNSNAQFKNYNTLPRKNIMNANACLNHTVLPSKYTLDLQVTENDIISGKFSGNVTITLNFSTNLDAFHIHAKDLKINDPITLVGNKFNGNIRADGPDANDLLTINSDAIIQAGDGYNLTINYNGTLSTEDMEGFYQSTYKDEKGNRKYLATTHFEEMGARRAFPCFDEPTFQATFVISITYTGGYFALSNTQVDVEYFDYGLWKTTFLETPRMPTYLVAFIVSQFDCHNTTQNNIDIQICAKNGTKDTMSLALSTTPRVLTIMKNYTNFDYLDMGFGKITQAAIPDLIQTGMENWALTTYRERALLYDDQESSIFYKQLVVGAISRVVSQQWFGNLITLDSWSNTFLKEGIGTYFQYQVTNDLNPSWEISKQFVIDVLHSSFVEDSFDSSLPLRYDTDNANATGSRSDNIPYTKGGSIIRMVQHFLGLDNFKKGLEFYLSMRPIGTVHNLWTSFQKYIPIDDSQKLPDTVENVMDNWTNKAGYPLLNVNLSENRTNVVISQQRFLISGNNNENTKWYIPITYTTSNNVDNFINTKTQAWLLPNSSLTLPLEGANWIILNNQQVGYYRINYDDELLRQISATLNSNLSSIDEISRSQLVDDQMNLARAGYRSYNDLLNFLSFLKNDDSYYTWTSAFSGFSYLLQRTSNAELRKNLTNYVTENMESLSKSVSVAFEQRDNQTYTLKQILALTWACNLGDTICVDYAKNQFVNYTKNETQKPSPNLRSIVYCNGLRTSENATEDFMFLWIKYLYASLSHEQLTILSALGCANDSSVRQLYLNKSLTGDIKIQDAFYVFSSVYTNNPDGVNDVLDFILNNYDKFEQRFSKKSPLTSLIYTIANLFTKQDQVDKLKVFSQNLESEELKGVIKDAVALATNNLNEIKSIEQDLKVYFRWPTQSSSTSMWRHYFFYLCLLKIMYFMLNYF